jgi:hypothetical protein
MKKAPTPHPPVSELVKWFGVSLRRCEFVAVTLFFFFNLQ